MAVNRDDNPALEVADTDFVSKGAGFHRFDEDAVKAGRGPLREILDRDAELGG